MGRTIATSPMTTKVSPELTVSQRWAQLPPYRMGALRIPILQMKCKEGWLSLSRSWGFERAGEPGTKLRPRRTWWLLRDTWKGSHVNKACREILHVIKSSRVISQLVSVLKKSGGEQESQWVKDEKEHLKHLSKWTVGKAPFSGSGGPYQRGLFWTTPSPIAPTPTITAHSPYNWSSFPHGTSHLLTYCALNWSVSTVRTEAYTYAWKRAGIESLFTELIHELPPSKF